MGSPAGAPEAAVAPPVLALQVLALQPFALDVLMAPAPGRLEVMIPLPNPPAALRPKASSAKASHIALSSHRASAPATRKTLPSDASHR